MAIKLVVMDIAGTTVKDDNRVGEAFQAALKQFGYEVPMGVITPLMGYEKKLAIREMLERYENDREKITLELIDGIHKHFVKGMIAYYEQTASLEFLPGVEDALATLRRKGIRVAINTGFSRDIAETIVNRLRWKEKELYDYLIASDEVELGRPHPFMIHQLMKEADIADPLEVAKVGDTEVDIREGQNAGCKYVVGVTTGAFSREELEPYKPTHIIDSMNELLPIIENGSKY